MKTSTAAAQPPVSQSIDALNEQAARSLHQNDFSAARRICTEILSLDPNNAPALNRLAIIEAKSGDLLAAVAHLKLARAGDPACLDVKRNLFLLSLALAQQKTQAGALGESLQILTELADDTGGDLSLGLSVVPLAAELGTTLYLAGRRECIDALRLALRFRTQPLLGHVDLHNYLWRFRERARLDDFTRAIEPEQLGKQVLIACFPKSGSTLLKRMLCEATGFVETQYVSAFLQNEEEIYLPALLAGARTNVVVQQHCRAGGPNLHLLQAFGVRPVVLVRDIFDVLLSWKEFLAKGANTNTYFPDFQKLSDEQQLASVVDDRAPWYLSFFAGWKHAIDTGYIDGFWMTYRALTGDPHKAIESILDFYGIQKDPVRVDAAVAQVGRGRADTRFNKGVVGRGRSAFTDDQVEQIRRLATYYPGVDFSMIGL